MSGSPDCGEGLDGPLDIALRGAAGAFTLDATLSAAPGETTAVFGPSGSGKTTLLRAVAGLARFAGRVRAGGEVWQDDGVFVPPHRRRVAFAFQQPALFPHLPVEENLRYADRRAAGRDGGPLSFARVVERLDLAPHLGRMPRGLSGGERQRVSLGRALLSRPLVALLDEPLSAIHQSARGRIAAWLRSLAGELGIAVLLVSHDLDEVIAVADRIALIEGGRITAVGTVSETLARMPVRDAISRFEAGAVLTARVVAHLEPLGLTELRAGGQTLRAPGIHAPPGSEVRLSVRARDVALATKPPEAISLRNVLRGVVRSVREDGPFAEIEVEVGEARIRARVTRDAAGELGIAPEREVFALLKAVSFDPP